MAGDMILYEWLERWEQALNRAEPADLDAFVESHCRQGDPVLVAEFRRRANGLLSLNRDLRAFGAPADARPDSPQFTNARSAARSTLTPGQEVVPGYPLERYLGGGGFGEVWQAHSPSGLPVALKFVRLGDRVAQVEQRALDVMSQVRHLHLLPVLDSWRTAGFLVIAMELADGTLAERLTQVRAEGQTGIPRDELLRYFEQAADALDFLNRSHQGPDGQDQPGIQHRDIKPQNLLLAGGALKIGDFGLARCLEHSVTSHTGWHTPAYAAPEFFDGKATSQSDQYSLAVTWCVLRGGRLPFQGSDAQIMAAHLRGNPNLSMIPLAERGPVRRALSKRPRQRWPSCGEFVAALRGCSRSAGRRGVKAGEGPAGLVRTVELRHRDCITALAFSSSSSVIASASRDRSVRLGDTETGRLVAIQPQGEYRWGFVSVAVSPDGSTVASVSQGGRKSNDHMMEPHLWQPRHRTRTQPGRTERYRYPFLSPAFSPADRVVAFACDRVRLFDIDSGDQRNHFPTEERIYPRCVCFSPDGQYVVSGDDDGRIDVWRVSGNQLLGLAGHHARITALAISPDGRLLASADESGALYLRRFPTGRQRRVVRKAPQGKPRETEPATYLAFFPDSTHLAAFHERKEGGLVRLWHTSLGAKGQGWSPAGVWLSCVALAPDGVLLATGDANGRVRLWSTAIVLQAPELTPPGTTGS